MTILKNLQNSQDNTLYLFGTYIIKFISSFTTALSDVQRYAIYRTEGSHQGGLQKLEDT